MGVWRGGRGLDTPPGIGEGNTCSANICSVEWWGMGTGGVLDSTGLDLDGCRVVGSTARPRRTRPSARLDDPTTEHLFEQPNNVMTKYPAPTTHLDIRSALRTPSTSRLSSNDRLDIEHNPPRRHSTSIPSLLDLDDQTPGPRPRPASISARRHFDPEPGSRVLDLDDRDRVAWEPTSLDLDHTTSRISSGGWVGG